MHHTIQHITVQHTNKQTHAAHTAEHSNSFPIRQQTAATVLSSGRLDGAVQATASQARARPSSSRGRASGEAAHGTRHTAAGGRRGVVAVAAPVAVGQKQQQRRAGRAHGITGPRHARAGRSQAAAAANNRARPQHARVGRGRAGSRQVSHGQVVLRTHSAGQPTGSLDVPCGTCGLHVSRPPSTASDQCCGTCVRAAYRSAGRSHWLAPVWLL